MTTRVAIAPLLAGGLREWSGGRTVVPGQDTAVLLLGAERERPSRYRVVPGGLASAAFGIDTEPDGSHVEVDLPGLLELRLAQSDWLLDVTLDRLRNRQSAGRPLAAHGHLRLRLSDAAAQLAEASAAASVPGATEYAHQTVTRADETLAELSGGTSVLTGSPGHCARFSALLALTFVGVM